MAQLVLNVRDLQFKSNHGHILLNINCTEKTKVKKKRSVNDPIFKLRLIQPGT